MVSVEGCALELTTFHWRAWTRCEIRIANHRSEATSALEREFYWYCGQSTKYQLTDEAIRDYVRVKPKLVNYYYYPTRIFMIMFDIYGTHMK